MLVIASRGSQLALWQARWVAAQLQAAGHECRIEIVKTTGDKITDVPLGMAGAQTGVKGLFTKEIEEALLDGRADLAVHSLKDLPTELPEGLTLAAVPELGRDGNLAASDLSLVSLAGGHLHCGAAVRWSALADVGGA